MLSPLNFSTTIELLELRSWTTQNNVEIQSDKATVDAKLINTEMELIVILASLGCIFDILTHITVVSMNQKTI